MEPKIVGHRGAKNELPENTLKAIRYGLECGVDAIEIDVHVTADGRLAVMHDPDVGRTTGGSGLLKEMTAAEIGALDAGDGERVPFLEDVLELTRKVTLFVEIKSADAEALVVDAVRKAGRIDSCIIKAFNHRYLKTVKDVCPELRCACLLEALPVHAYRLAVDAGAEFVSMNCGGIDRAAVDECHANGIGVCVWTAENREQRERFTEMGVDYIITGTPGVVCGK